jgi:hypothetical protein
LDFQRRTEDVCSVMYEIYRYVTIQKVNSNKGE